MPSYQVQVRTVSIFICNDRFSGAESKLSFSVLYGIV